MWSQQTKTKSCLFNPQPTIICLFDKWMTNSGDVVRNILVVFHIIWHYSVSNKETHYLFQSISVCYICQEWHWAIVRREVSILWNILYLVSIITTLRKHIKKQHTHVLISFNFDTYKPQYYYCIICFT